MKDNNNMTRFVEFKDTNGNISIKLESIEAFYALSPESGTRIHVSGDEDCYYDVSDSYEEVARKLSGSPTINEDDGNPWVCESGNKVSEQKPTNTTKQADNTINRVNTTPIHTYITSDGQRIKSEWFLGTSVLEMTEITLFVDQWRKKTAGMSDAQKACEAWRLANDYYTVGRKNEQERQNSGYAF